MLSVNIYIDGNNLHRSAKNLGFDIDYRRFGVWLRQKYNPTKAYLFVGFMPSKTGLYEYLRSCGFTLVFKETAVLGGSIKGNCDAEIVLQVVSDFYTRSYDQAILISGDGDFGCLVEFLSKHEALMCLIVPDKKRCSFLLRKKNQHIVAVFLNEHYHKFTLKPKEAPDADASA